MTHDRARARRPIVAVIGGSEEAAPVLAAAEAVGRLLVDGGARVANGGRGGVMAASARGAKSSSRAREGDTVGILPGPVASDANPWIDIAIPTAMGHARNVALTNLADAVVAVGGGAGTLSEIAMAWQQDKPIVLLDVGSGWSSALGARTLDDRRATPLDVATTPEAAARLALAHCAQRPPK